MPSDKNKEPRVIIVVLDSLGLGELPDAPAFGDAGCNTLGNICRDVKIALPHLQSLGLANIIPLKHISPIPQPRAAWGKMCARSPGKDTTSGHWEMAGLVLEQAFPLFPNGFPLELMEEFSRAIGRGWLGNIPASGLAIIDELGPQHQESGSPIVYTSGDSVFQIAAHEEVIPLAELYRICRLARELLQGPYGVGRVIARPFLGSPGSYYRTANRRDFSQPPPPHGLLEKVKDQGLEVISVGKIADIFADAGISRSIEAHDNQQALAGIHQALEESRGGLIFANLVDFDSLYGHRNDVLGYAKALEEFDAALPRLLGALKEGDLLFLSSDHGNDPTYPGTDHTREYALLLAYGAGFKTVDLGIRTSFADLGATAAEYLQAGKLPAGTSFLKEIQPDSL